MVAQLAQLAGLVEKANLVHICGRVCPVLATKCESVLRRVPGGRITDDSFCNGVRISWSVTAKGQGGARSQTVGTQRVSDACRQKPTG